MEQEREDDPYEAIQFGDFGTYIRHKKQKLQLQQEEIAALAAPDTAQIFEGIVVYVNGYTDPPIHELKNMIVQRGGEFRQYLSKNSTTHIIASNLTQAKMREFRNYKVAKPEWITESVKANKLLQWHKFSTLRVPTSLSKLGEAFLTQSSMAPSPPSHHTNTGSGSADPEHKGPDPAPLEVLDDIHVDLPDHHDQDFLMLGKRVRACVDRDAGVALGAVDNKVESAEPFWDDEDLFLDDLELDHFEFQPTPPTNVFEATVALPVSYDSESDQGLRPKACLRSEHAEVGTAVTVDINSTNGREAVLDESHPTLIELSVPWNRLNSSVQPGFVEKFYQSSRLHYLSTWKIRLKDITTEIQKDRVPALSKDKNKIIMHVDFDCFFASVATRSKPELRDLPIAVAHGSGGSTSNSEIASCNYLARGYGVKNGMQLLRARALCPDLLVVPYEFQEYEDISIEFYKILLTYADELQAVSVDEALLDVTSKCLPLWDQRKSNTADHRGDVSSSRMAPGMLADRVREQIFLATGCHASVGVAPNVLLAKLATKRAKPHGQYIWPGAPGSEETLRELRGPKPLPMDTDIDTSLTPSGSEDGSQPIKRDFPVVNQSSNLKEFSVNDLPGVGHKTKQELKERFSVQTLYELQQVSREELQRICGMKTGEMLYNSCRGIDETTLASDRDKARQSVSAEISWGVRFENQDQVDVFLWDLAREVSKRLKEIDRKGKSVVMKVMKRKEYVVGHWKHLGHGPVDQFARTGQLPMYTDDPDIIAREARNLLQHFKFSVLDLRGLGIQVLKLNNEVINAVSKTAFASLDSMNQTTLSAAMFQRRVPTAIVGGSVDPGKILLYEHLTPFPKSMELSEPKNEVSQGDLTLEIDSETFKELPTDIQEELSRHHRFVFVNQNGSETTNTASSEEMQLNDHPGLDLCAPLHHRSKDKDLAPPAVDHTLLPWSQVDPAELVALSTPAMRDTLKEYAGMNRYSHARSSTLHIDDPQHLETGILPSPSKAS
ncbi:deoxycytidyl transferase [Mortierella sp. AD094]|nr:deoxycytidyl transferase [Mortierella sp. AD094]